MQQYISFLQIEATLSDLAVQLQAASGKDSIISQADLDRLLLPIYPADTPRAQTLAALFNLAMLLETEKRPRISRSDIDRTLKVVREQILPALRLVEGPLSIQAANDLYLYGVAYTDLAGKLKAYVYELLQRPAAGLVLQLRPLLKGLRFNTFHRGEADIAVDFAPFNADRISNATFLLSLEESGNPDWEGISYRFGRANEDPFTPKAFWDEFVGSHPEESDRERAQAVERLWKMHLHGSRPLRYDNDGVTYFVFAGINGLNEMVFMLYQYIWT